MTMDGYYEAGYDLPEHSLERFAHLRAEPMNISLRDLVRGLTQGKVLYVQLEPGDATRYDLMMFSHAESFQHPSAPRNALWTWIIRERGGDPVACDSFRLWPDDPFARYKVGAALSDGSHYTAAFLSWWLDELAREADRALSFRSTLPPTFPHSESHDAR